MALNGFVVSQCMGRISCSSSASLCSVFGEGLGGLLGKGSAGRPVLGLWPPCTTSHHPALLISGASVAQNSSFSPSGLQFCPDWLTCIASDGFFFLGSFPSSFELLSGLRLGPSHGAMCPEGGRH